ncbi:MAG: hypothetical protein JWO05_1561 [Gemmatimonadetes bacterium]|nr:hypothetical protein [Gemmatimonadota bacterium]
MSPTPESAATSPIQKERRQRVKGWQSRDALRVAGLLLLLYYGLRLFWVANPLFLVAFLGMLFGLAVASGADRLEKFGVRRGIGAPLVVITFFALLVGFGAWMAPTLREQGKELRKKLPEAVDRAEAWVNKRESGVFGSLLGRGDSSATSARKDSASATPAQPAQPNADASAPSASETLKARMGKQLGGATRFLFPFLTSTIAAIGGMLIIIFLSIYIAADPGLYHRGIMLLFPKPNRQRAGEVLSAMANVLRRWLVTQLIAMAVIGSVTTIVLLILHVKAAFALGLLAGLFEFIPTVGPIFSAVPAVAMGFLDSPHKALLVVAAYVLIQFIENHLLIPLLMKGGVDLPPALTILAQALLALLFGFLGLMVAVPLLAATMVGVKLLYVEGVLGEPMTLTERALVGHHDAEGDDDDGDDGESS